MVQRNLAKIKTPVRFWYLTHMWELNIKKLNNGYLLIGDEFEQVIEEEEKDGGDQECMTRVLESISDYFGFTYDGFSEKNLNIKWDKKGDEI